MDKKTILNLSYVTMKNGAFEVPYREVKSKRFGGAVKFAPSSFDKADEIYDEDIYAYVDDDVFLNYDDEAFKDYVMKYYD